MERPFSSLGIIYNVTQAIQGTPASALVDFADLDFK